MLELESQDTGSIADTAVEYLALKVHKEQLIYAIQVFPVASYKAEFNAVAGFLNAAGNGLNQSIAYINGYNPATVIFPAPIPSSSYGGNVGLRIQNNTGGALVFRVIVWYTSGLKGKYVR